MDEFTLTQLEAFDINDAWFQCVKKCVESGRVYKITRGSYAGQRRKEFDFITGIIRNPGNRPLHIIIPEGSSLPAPNDEDYIANYFAAYLMSDAKTPDEDYTYGERLTHPKLRGLDRILSGDIKAFKLTPELELQFKAKLNEVAYKKNSGDEKGINPVEEAIDMYVNGGFGTNQATMEIAMPTDILLKDPPCLRIIDTRIRYGQLHFIVYFRSWDLVGGFPSNLGAIQLMKEYMVGEINSRMNDKYDGLFNTDAHPGLKDGHIVFTSKGLHIYDHQWEYANLRLGKDSKKTES